MRSIVVWSALALTIFLPLLAQAEYSSAHSTKLATVPNEFLLRYSSKRFSALDKLQIEQRLGVSTVRTHPLTNTALVVVRSGQAIDDRYAKELLASGIVEYIEPNYILSTTTTPNDPQLAQLWGLHNSGHEGGTADIDIDGPEAWSETTGSSDVVVGVVDTGIDYNHPDLAENIWRNPTEVANGRDDDANGVVDDLYGYNAINPQQPPLDDNGHGTHCAGTIGATGNNSLGVVGVNWRVKLMALKFLSASGSGTTDDAIAAIEYAVRKKQSGVNLRVLSNSWGGGGFSQALDSAIGVAANNGILFVAAAGNAASNNDDSPSYPASYDRPNIVSVAALDHDGNLASFSNYGPSSVDIGAPGVGILSTSLGGSYRLLSGTSMAAPHVSGVAALVLAKAPQLSAIELKERITRTFKPLSTLNGSVVAPGIVSAERAVKNTQSPIPPSGPTIRYSKASASIDYQSDLGVKILEVDDGYSVQELSKSFLYYGKSYNRLAISANGRIVPLAAQQNAPTLPDYSNRLASGIHVLNDDLYPSPLSPGLGGVWLRQKENGFVVTWISVPYAYRNNPSSERELRIQADVSSNGNISFHYLDTDVADPAFDSGASATVGLAPVDGGEALTVSSNTPNAAELGVGKALEFQILGRKSKSDFDGDGISDFILWRPTTASFYILRSTDNFELSRHWVVALGSPGDQPLVGDFDGDSRLDLAVWKAKSGVWLFKTSLSGYSQLTSAKLGKKGDKPLVGDLDGDGSSDLVVYRKKDGFYTLLSSIGFRKNSTLAKKAGLKTRFKVKGTGIDPLLADFNGDGTEDFVTVGQSTRLWTAYSPDGRAIFSHPWGVTGDTPLTCDWDGNGLADRVQVRTEPNYELSWYIITDSGSTSQLTFGSVMDTPSCSFDFDGDGKLDPSVFRASTGMWYYLSSLAQSTVELPFGLPGDLVLGP